MTASGRYQADARRHHVGHRRGRHEADAERRRHRGDQLEPLTHFVDQAPLRDPEPDTERRSAPHPPAPTR